MRWVAVSVAVAVLLALGGAKPNSPVVGGLVHSLSPGGFPNMVVLGQGAPDEEADGDGDGGDASEEDDGDTEPLPEPWKASMPVDKVRSKIRGMMDDAANTADAATKTKGDIFKKMSEYRSKGKQPEPEAPKPEKEEKDDDKEEDDSADEPNPWPVEMPVDEARGKMKGLISDAEAAAMSADKQKGKMMKVIKKGSQNAQKFLEKFLKTRNDQLDAAQKKTASAQKKEEKIDAKIEKEKAKLLKGKGKGKGKKGKGKKEGGKEDGKGDGKEEEDEKAEEAEEKKVEPEGKGKEEPAAAPAAAGSGKGTGSGSGPDVEALQAELEKTKELLATLRDGKARVADKYAKVVKELKALEEQCGRVDPNAKAEEHGDVVSLVAQAMAKQMRWPKSALPRMDIAARANIANAAVKDIYKLIAVPAHVKVNTSKIAEIVEETASKVDKHATDQLSKAKENRLQADDELQKANEVLESFKVKSAYENEKALASGEFAKEDDAQAKKEQKEAKKAQQAAGSGAGSGNKGKGKTKCKCEKGKGKKKKKQDSPMVKKLKAQLNATVEKEQEAEAGELIPLPEVPNSGAKEERDAFGFSPRCLACKAACEEEPACNAMCYVAQHDKSPCP